MDFLKIFLPVLTVTLAGFIALFNLRHSIRLQEKNKWKADFRVFVSEYLETFMKYSLDSIEFIRAKNNNKLTARQKDNLRESSSILLGRYTKVHFMLDPKNKDTTRLSESYTKHK